MAVDTASRRTFPEDVARMERADLMLALLKAWISGPEDVRRWMAERVRNAA